MSHVGSSASSIISLRLIAGTVPLYRWTLEPHIPVSGGANSYMGHDVEEQKEPICGVRSPKNPSGINPRFVNKSADQDWFSFERFVRR